MLSSGIVTEAQSHWCSPVLLVHKKNGERRFCLDLRRLNGVTKLTSYPLPTIEDILDVVAEQRPTLFTSFDLKAGHWQSKLHPDTADRSGFQTDRGSYIFQRLCFGLAGAVQFFQEIMQKVLRGLTPSTCKNDYIYWRPHPVY
jgi:hypothetical protein